MVYLDRYGKHKKLLHLCSSPGLVGSWFSFANLVPVAFLYYCPWTLSIDLLVRHLWQLWTAMMSLTMSWVGCLQKDSELFILFARNSQILLKISVIPILLIFIYLVALNLLIKQPTQLIVQLNSSFRRIIVSNEYRN